MNGLIPLGYMGLIFIASVMPDVQATHSFWAILPDNLLNLLHMPAYGLLAFLWILTLRTYGFTKRFSILVAIVIALTYGSVLELAQAYVPGRDRSAMDVVTDLVGVVVFILLYQWMRVSGFRFPKRGF